MDRARILSACAALAASLLPATSAADTLAPQVTDPPPARIRFVADPVVDGAVLALAGGTALLANLLISTGEIRPQQPTANSSLLGIDRFAITQTVDERAGTRSTVGLGLAVAYAVIDPIASAFRFSGQAMITDAVIYAETISVNEAVTMFAKVAVRRPRPSAYRQQQELYAQYGEDAPDITSTNSALSFYSGHASTTAAIGATATYLAFARDPRGVRPWITLGVATVLTTFVSYERVRSGEHFPTDVIAGALAGGGVGIIVSHLHRADAPRQRARWTGMLTVTPVRGDGAMLTGYGQF